MTHPSIGCPACREYAEQRLPAVATEHAHQQARAGTYPIQPLDMRIHMAGIHAQHTAIPA